MEQVQEGVRVEWGLGGRRLMACVHDVITMWGHGIGVMDTQR